MYTSARRRIASFSLLLIFSVANVIAHAQTFRGAINGSVTDTSGAVVAGAQVVATETATGVTHNSLSSSAGDFSFPDLPLGSYQVTVSDTGFNTVKVENVPVSAGTIYSVPVKLTVASSAEVVEVSASALSLDTTTSTQTATVGAKAVSNLPLNGRDYTQLLGLTPGFSGYSGGVTSGSGSLNGMRFEQMNWQVDGVDNNDLWANIPAVNQSGVNGIAGTLLPLDSVEQFSVQTQASAEAGRNAGGVINLALKSGTNALHGTAYYFNRNEAFAQPSPFIAYGENKQENRTYNVGGSVGGAIIKDKLFYFVTYEKQVFAIGQPGEAVEPSAAYQAEAKAVMAQYGIPVNPVSTNLLNTLWPSYALTGPAGGENYNSPDPEFGHSNNGLIKLDYTLNAKNSISAHWFGGQGNQTAPDGSELLYYYTVGPIHIYNYALQWNYTPTNNITNQVLAGVNYFNQIFDDEKTDFNIAATGFISGSTYPGVAPHIRISGFDPVGIVAPSGRNDITGHLDDTLSWTKGKHEFRFGGEYRQAQIDAFNSGDSSGAFNFTGAQGLWKNDQVSDANVLSLADFLAGLVDTSTLDVGDPKRQVFVNTFSLFAQDAWRLSPRFTANYGLRYDYEGPLHNTWKDLSVFRPNAGGLAFQGAGINSIYPQDWTNFSPRLGFSYQPFDQGNTVLRGGIGLYFDQPVMSAFLNNKTSNSSPIGIQSNPAGPNPVFTISKPAYQIQSGQQIFPSSQTASCTVTQTPLVVSPCGIFTVSPNFRTPYVVNYNINIQQALGPKLLFQIGYVGNESRKLVSTVDINQAAFSSGGSPSTTADSYTQQASRPYFSQFPTYGNINQLGTIATGNFNSFQTLLKFANYHGLTAQASYVWGHAFDEMSQSRSLLPQNSFNFKGDYGNSGLDTRDNFTTFLSYTVPTFSQRMRRLSEGWVVNGLITLHTGQPFTVYNSQDTSGTDENAQRVNLIANPYAGISHKFFPATSTASATEQWVNPAAFASPANGQLGTMPRNALYGPGYTDADLSVFKTTHITERISLQLRGEVFNAFNNKNFAPPNNTIGGGFGELYSTIGNFWGAPGVGPGEPLNAQLGGKIIF
jgi:Carboxypeptidase regulatory-like domain/TonB dependent receptor